MARSLLELADALEELGSKREAAEAHFDAQREFQKVPDTYCADLAFARGVSQALEYDPEYYLEIVPKALGLSQIEGDRTTADQFVELIEPLLQRAPETGLVPVLGRHLHVLRNKLAQPLRPALLWRLW
jgi:hypothetical protein